jgi:uncharacterized protein YdiU (UPF0061 family)
LPFADQPKLEKTLQDFGPVFRAAFNDALLDRLGLISAGDETDQKLATATWQFLADSRMPFERFFFDWRGGLAHSGRAETSPAAATYATESFAAVRNLLESFEARSSAILEHPYFSRPEPCTMLIDEVEAIWAPIAENDDWSLFEAKLAAIAEMREAYRQQDAA